MDNGPHPDSSHQTSNGEMEAPHRLCPSPMDWWQQDSAQVPSAFVPNLSHVALISPRWPHIHDRSSQLSWGRRCYHPHLACGESEAGRSPELSQGHLILWEVVLQHWDSSGWLWSLQRTYTSAFQTAVCKRTQLMFLKCPSAAPGWGLKLCMSNKLLGACDAVWLSATSRGASLAN